LTIQNLADAKKAIEESRRAKISKWRLGKPRSLEVRVKISKGMLGKVLTVEHRKNISLGIMGMVFTEEHKKNMSKGLLGKRRTFTEEHKQNISRGLSGRTFSEEHKKKLRDRVLSEESKQILRDRLRQIPSKDTTIEVFTQESLVRHGIAFLTHTSILGQPDIQLLDYRVLIFIDGCYWHSCRKCGFINEQTNTYDENITTTLRTEGWLVIRIWEHDIRSDHDIVIKKLEEYTTMTDKMELEKWVN